MAELEKMIKRGKFQRPYEWLDEKPNINNDYLFSGLTTTGCVKSNVVLKLLRWCFG